MSKRYGRNQKRAHREEIARLKTALLMEQGLREYFADKYYRANGQIKEMVSIITSVCEYSVVLPPKIIKGRGKMDYYRLAAPTRVPDIVDIWRPLSVDSLQTIDLFALKVYLEKHYERFSIALHLEYSAGGHSAYMISEAALQRMSDEDITRKITPEVAKALVKHFRKERP